MLGGRGLTGSGPRDTPLALESSIRVRDSTGFVMKTSNQTTSASTPSLSMPMSLHILWSWTLVTYNNPAAVNNSMQPSSSQQQHATQQQSTTACNPATNCSMQRISQHLETLALALTLTR